MSSMTKRGKKKSPEEIPAKVAKDSDSELGPLEIEEGSQEGPHTPPPIEDNQLVREMVDLGLEIGFPGTNVNQEALKKSEILLGQHHVKEQFQEEARDVYDDIVSKVDDLWGTAKPTRNQMVLKIWTITTLLCELGKQLLRNTSETDQDLEDLVAEKLTNRPNTNLDKPELEKRMEEFEISLPERISLIFKSIIGMTLTEFKDSYRKHTTDVCLIKKSEKQIEAKAVEEFRKIENQLTTNVALNAAEIVVERTEQKVIDSLKPKMLQEIGIRTKELFDKQEPSKPADAGNMMDPEAIWPNKHLATFAPNAVSSLTDSQSLDYLEPMMAVMGNGLRTLTNIIGFINEDMDQKELSHNIRQLLVHYNKDLTCNEPNGRIITESIANHLVDQWIQLTNFLTIPGRLNKTAVGDILNNLMAHLDGEILPLGNKIVGNLRSLKFLMSENTSVTNLEVMQAIIKTVGPVLRNELTTGRTMTPAGTTRDDVGDDFNFWKRNPCHKFPERCITDLRLETDRHRVSGWTEMYSLEAKKKGKETLLETTVEAQLKKNQ